MAALLVVFNVVLIFVNGKQGFGPGEQDWGYVLVRPKAHMFWWLYETTAQVSNITERPLVIWHQGGPGGSSTGYGNFAEIGPLDEDLQPRNHTWLRDANLLFIDSPVGTGFSYAEDFETLAKNNVEVGTDLVTCLTEFLKLRPEFRQVPIYVAAESYGGKVAVEFALQLYHEIKVGRLQANLRGISLVDSWISPVDSILTWAPYLYNLGIIDNEGYKNINREAMLAEKAIQEGDYLKALQHYTSSQSAIYTASHNVDFYNVLSKKSSSPPLKKNDESSKIDRIMKNQIKPALNLTWSGSTFNATVFFGLNNDFMKPVTSTVEQLIKDTDIKVQVLMGQLDLIVDTPGTMRWVEKLSIYPIRKQKRTKLIANGIIEGYKQKIGKLFLYWIIRAGHMVPRDNPNAMKVILDELLDEK